MTNILFDQKGLPGRFHDYLRKTYKGGNFEKYLAFYVDQVGGSHYSDKKYWPQVDRLNKIRNCIVHISGFIGDSRDKEELIRIVKSRDYLHKDDQSGPRVELWVKEGAITNRNEGYYDLGEIDIEGCEDDGDERLVIGGGYCNRMCWYLRSFAIEMIERTDMVVYANWDD